MEMQRFEAKMLNTTFISTLIFANKRNHCKKSYYVTLTDIFRVKIVNSHEVVSTDLPPLVLHLPSICSCYFYYKLDYLEFILQLYPGQIMENFVSNFPVMLTLAVEICWASEAVGSQPVTSNICISNQVLARLQIN